MNKSTPALAHEMLARKRLVLGGRGMKMRTASRLRGSNTVDAALDALRRMRSSDDFSRSIQQILSEVIRRHAHPQLAGSDDRDDQQHRSPEHDLNPDAVA